MERTITKEKIRFGGRNMGRAITKQTTPTAAPNRPLSRMS